ncbi:MAG TPA: bacteriohopanetetrol glucosamine biosynthesis glycosyltransferase HpnI [Terriglobales bacterium]|jgi:ceramide glucosyltransferase|nr:bacteriohopanetetrol glucosamine biosynthesis glycosyltransferase HpnI [Terriglobales bacterium]
MLHYITQSLEIIAVAGTLASVTYYGLCLYSAALFLRERKAGESARTTQIMPPVSLLKPLKGTDPEMYESFRSHCLQDYPEYEIVFGVSDPDDPAIKLVERLQAEFPQRAIRLVVCRKNLGANTKVSNLAQMLPEARYEYLIVNDSDIRVEQDYLRRVVPPLANPKVGMVTCLYRGVAAATAGSRLESLGISTDFCGGVLAARLLEGIRFGLGSTLAFRRSDLSTIGGFEALVDYLADDYELGNRIVGPGREGYLSEVVVETFLPPYSVHEFIDHQLRWARTVRDARRWGYVGIVWTFGLPWALLTLAMAHGATWAWGLLAVTAGMRLLMGVVVGRVVLRDPQVTLWLWLIPLRDVVALMVWVASFAGHTVAWRGDSFTLKDGRLMRITP